MFQIPNQPRRFYFGDQKLALTTSKFNVLACADVMQSSAYHVFSPSVKLVHQAGPPGYT